LPSLSIRANDSKKGYAFEAAVHRQSRVELREHVRGETHLAGHVTLDVAGEIAQLRIGLGAQAAIRDAVEEDQRDDRDRAEQREAEHEDVADAHALQLAEKAELEERETEDDEEECGEDADQQRVRDGARGRGETSSRHESGHHPRMHFRLGRVIETLERHRMREETEFAPFELDARVERARLQCGRFDGAVRLAEAAQLFEFRKGGDGGGAGRVLPLHRARFVCDDDRIEDVDEGLAQHGIEELFDRDHFLFRRSGAGRRIGRDRGDAQEVAFVRTPDQDALAAADVRRGRPQHFAELRGDGGEDAQVALAEVGGLLLDADEVVDAEEDDQHREDGADAGAPAGFLRFRIDGFGQFGHTRLPERGQYGRIDGCVAMLLLC
jgi:hypothetical protein